MTDLQPRCLLYAVVDVGPGAAERLAAALNAVQIASVLIRPAAETTLTARDAKPLVELARGVGTAALIAEDAALALAVKADGVHLGISLDPAEAYAEARRILGTRAIIGVDAGISRDGAMTMAEEGAEYVAFGAPPDLRDLDRARARRGDLIGWWSEIFEVPCVAFDVESALAAEDLARAGADFVAVTLPVAEPPAASHDLVAGIAAALSLAEACE